MDGTAGRTIFTLCYFALSVYFAIDPSSVVDKIGKFLTPVLLVLLVYIVVRAVVAPLGGPVDTGVDTPFYSGFITGYQTGDVLTGLIFGVMFLQALNPSGGAEPHGFLRSVGIVGLVTFLGLLVVYGGLTYLGATGSGLFAADIERAPLLTGLVERLAGTLGVSALAAAVLFACLTTAIGATAVMARYTVIWTRGRIPYRAAVIITTVVATFQAFGGVERVVAIAGPIFGLMYPVAICITVLGLVSRLFTNDGVWKGMALMAVIIGVYDCLSATGELVGFELPSWLQSAYAAIPLAGNGFAWLVPAVLGAIVGGAAWRLSGRPSVGNGPSPGTPAPRESTSASP